MQLTYLMAGVSIQSGRLKATFGSRSVYQNQYSIVEQFQNHHVKFKYLPDDKKLKACKMRKIMHFTRATAHTASKIFLASFPVKEMWQFDCDWDWILNSLVIDTSTVVKLLYALLLKMIHGNVRKYPHAENLNSMVVLKQRVMATENTGKLSSDNLNRCGNRWNFLFWMLGAHRCGCSIAKICTLEYKRKKCREWR